MAMPNPERTPIEQLLKLVDELSRDELAQLRQKIDSKDWSTKWHDLFAEVDEQNRDLPPLSEEEIAAEVDAVREEMKANRAP